jgi:hypothetical protein
MKKLWRGGVALALLSQSAIAQPALPGGQSAPIAITTATTTQLIAAPSTATLTVLVTAWDVIAGGTGNLQLVYGTGTNCGTGQGNLTGNYPLTAQAGISKGNGAGVVLVVPRGNAVCAVTSANVTMAGSITYEVL